MRPQSLVKTVLFSFMLFSAGSYSLASEGDLRSDSNCELSSQAADLIRLINVTRSETHYCGSAKLKASEPLTPNCRLQQSAEGHANTLAKIESLSHLGKGNSRLGDRVTSSGYAWSAVGENIAKGQPTAPILLADWLASKKHCKNLLKADYQEIGVARTGAYWVAVFARPQ